MAPGSAAGRPGEDKKANLHGKARDAGQRKQKDEEEQSAVPEPRFAPAVMAPMSQQVSRFERLAIKTANPSILDEPRTPAEDTFSVPDTTAGFSSPSAATTDSVASDAIASERTSPDN
ncbi:hypothetical protein F503_00829 [Ophiostoma piceae UAMH 11346]|uniref:Uncharacterized protein n=1 Tax=Ophiostoma piceae (strain UAMH 11346) TaxID=1262450 RepID=S3C7X7_OPHP1|nr:hypothetical protein F503_00829 [Ophiostoma piceae UAMH 11346]